MSWSLKSLPGVTVEHERANERAVATPQRHDDRRLDAQRFGDGARQQVGSLGSANPDWVITRHSAGERRDEARREREVLERRNDGSIGTANRHRHELLLRLVPQKAITAVRANNRPHHLNDALEHLASVRQRLDVLLKREQRLIDALIDRVDGGVRGDYRRLVDGTRDEAGEHVGNRPVADGERLVVLPGEVQPSDEPPPVVEREDQRVPHP